jgi:NodT family efflux transporter outer membrane factor (OMF) lipoprotein
MRKLFKISLFSLLLASACTLLISACAVGPDYHRPEMAAPASYKELGNWKPARPADMDHGSWWLVYNDPVLGALEKQVSISNQNLKASEAAYREAVAAVQLARASFFPTVALDGSGQRAKGNKGAVANTVNLTADASWAPDIWGRIRQTVTAQEATAQASAADLAAATLSAQGTLAVDYFELRAADQLARLLHDTVIADERSLKITKNQYKVGVVARSDVAQAQTQVDTVRAQEINVGVQRSQLEHAIAVLTGRAPADFSLKPAGDLPNPPVIPAGVPSTLLERRPDIAAAERQVAAANANIGVAMTAYYPDLTLTGSGGFAAATFGKLLQASSEVWTLGPQLALTLFDGGARAAQVSSARAAYDQQAALYRQTVLTAFQQVEDNLAALRIQAQQEKIQVQAVREAVESTKLITNQYTAGIVAYTSVVTAQTQELSNRQSELTVRENNLVASIQLIEALGGGWDSNSLPQKIK